MNDEDLLQGSLPGGDSQRYIKDTFGNIEHAITDESIYIDLLELFITNYY